MKLEILFFQIVITWINIFLITNIKHKTAKNYRRETIVSRLYNQVTMAIFNWIDKFMTDFRHDTIKYSVIYMTKPAV